MIIQSVSSQAARIGRRSTTRRTINRIRKGNAYFAELWHLRRFNRAGKRHRVRGIDVVVMRRATADTEPPREAAVVPRGFQEVHVVYRHILKPPLVAERARLMQRVSQLTVASARSERQVFIMDFSFAGVM